MRERAIRFCQVLLAVQLGLLCGHIIMEYTPGILISAECTAVNIGCLLWLLLG